MATPHVSLDSVDAKAIQKSSAEMLVLSLIEDRDRHGYEIAKLIEERSDQRLQFHIASLYPLLYRLEGRGWVEGRWVEKAGERRRRFYALTKLGRKALAAQRQSWREMVDAISRVADIRHA